MLRLGNARIKDVVKISTKDVKFVVYNYLSLSILIATSGTNKTKSIELETRKGYSSSPQVATNGDFENDAFKESKTKEEIKEPQSCENDGTGTPPPRFEDALKWRDTRTWGSQVLPLISNERERHGLPEGKDLQKLYLFSKKLRVLNRQNYWKMISDIIENGLFEYVSPSQIRVIFYFWLYGKARPESTEDFFSFIKLMINSENTFDLLDYNKVLWYLTREHAFEYADTMIPYLWEQMQINNIQPDCHSYDLITTSFVLSRNYMMAGIFAERMLHYGYSPSDVLKAAISKTSFSDLKKSFDSTPESQIRNFSILLGWHTGSRRL